MFIMKNNTSAWAVFTSCILVFCIGVLSAEVLVNLLFGFLCLVPILALAAFLCSLAYLAYQTLFANFEAPKKRARQIAKEQAEAKRLELEKEFEEKFDPMFYR